MVSSSGTYEHESTCATTCFDPTLLQEPVEYRYQCDEAKFQCELKKSPTDFTSGTPLADSQYINGPACNKQCAPQVKYACGGPKSEYTCSVATWGTFESAASCAMDCHASGDAGCVSTGGYCSTDQGAEGICTTNIGPCVAIGSATPCSSSNCDGNGGGTKPPTSTSCLKEGKWCRTSAGAEGLCTNTSSVPVSLECRKDATAVPVALQVNGEVTLTGVAIKTAADKTEVEADILKEAGADSGQFEYTVSGDDSTRRRRQLQRLVWHAVERRRRLNFFEQAAKNAAKAAANLAKAAEQATKTTAAAAAKIAEANKKAALAVEQGVKSAAEEATKKTAEAAAKVAEGTAKATLKLAEETTKATLAAGKAAAELAAKAAAAAEKKVEEGVKAGIREEAQKAVEEESVKKEEAQKKAEEEAWKKEKLAEEAETRESDAEETEKKKTKKNADEEAEKKVTKTTVSYTLGYQTEAKAESARTGMRGSTFHTALMTRLTGARRNGHQGFKAKLRSVQVKRVADSPRSTCESQQGKEWYVSDLTCIR